MPKLGRVLLAQLIIAISIVFLLFFVLNTLFLDKYYLYEKKQELKIVNSELSVNEISSLSESHGWLFIRIPFTTEEDKLNLTLLELFDRKDMPLNKFWLIKDNIEFINKGIVVQQIWNQGKMKMSVLLRFLKKDSDLIVVGTAVSHSSEITEIINKFLLAGLIISFLIISFLALVFVRKRVKPLYDLTKMSEEIALLNFSTINIKTGDEIEVLASRMNLMSIQLKEIHERNIGKNADLKFLLSRLSHELKTPLANIKAYVVGIEEGLVNEKSFEIIQDQIEKIDNLIIKTLELAALEQMALTIKEFSIIALFRSIYNSLPNECKDVLSIEVYPLRSENVLADPDQIEIVLRNLILNACQYRLCDKIDIVFESVGNFTKFSIINKFNTLEIDLNKLEQIWLPFYSMQKQSGQNGLGLYLVKNILDRHKSDFGVYIINSDRIAFSFSLNNPLDTLM